jgi:hypothetical protein
MATRAGENFLDDASFTHAYVNPTRADHRSYDQQSSTSWQRSVRLQDMILRINMRLF